MVVPLVVTPGYAACDGAGRPAKKSFLTKSPTLGRQVAGFRHFLMAPSLKHDLSGPAKAVLATLFDTHLFSASSSALEIAYLKDSGHKTVDFCGFQILPCGKSTPRATQGATPRQVPNKPPRLPIVCHGRRRCQGASTINELCGSTVRL